MKSYLLLITTLLLILCSDKKNIHSYSITKFKEVGFDYSYSNTPFYYNNRKYEPIITSKFRNDSLVSVTIYKYEGGIEYTKANIDSDSLLKKYINQPDVSKLELNNMIIFDNEEKYKVLTLKKDSIFCIKQDILILYVLL